MPNDDNDTDNTVSSIVGGIALVIAAGVLNGSWNASFSPQLGLAVGRHQRRSSSTSSTSNNVIAATRTATVEHNGQQSIATTTTTTKTNIIDLDHHHAWILFQFYAAILNIPICIQWTGGRERTAWIVQQSSAADISLTCLFSLLWGIGSVGFGVACRIAGVGLGTNLVMGVIMVAGTLLPLILEQVLWTAQGAVILAGLAVCALGLYCSVKSLWTRDADDKVALKAAAAAAAAAIGTATTSIVRQCDKGEQEINEENDEAVSTNQCSEESNEENGMVLLPCSKKNSLESKPTTTSTASTTTSTFRKVLICIITGIFASQLQFAFVFGQDMIDLAESDDGPGETPSSGSAAIVWLFAFTISVPVSIVYGLYNSSADIPISTLWRCPWYRHVLVILTTTLPWISHIHLYGIANKILPEALAASVSWPVLMMMTVATGMMWSLLLVR